MDSLKCVYACVSMGYIGPMCVILFFVISTVVNKFLMSPVVALVFQQEQLEGDFRYILPFMCVLCNC